MRMGNLLAFLGCLALAPQSLRAGPLQDLKTWGADPAIDIPRFARGRDAAAEPLLDVRPPVEELSAAVLDRKTSVLWTLGDSGTGPTLGRTQVSLKTGFSAAGGPTERIHVSGAENEDWEAMAMDPEGFLWIVDAGDNHIARRSVVLYRLDPASVRNSEAAVSRRIEVRYPDGARDVEAALILGTRLFLIQKTVWGLARVAWVDLSPQAPQSQLAQKAGLIDLNIVTDASISPSGKVYLLSYEGIWAVGGWFDPARDDETLAARKISGVKDIVGKRKDWWQFESLVALSDEDFLIGEEQGHFFRRTRNPGGSR